MQFGIFTVGDVTADPTTGRVEYNWEDLMNQSRNIGKRSHKLQMSPLI